MTGLVQLTFGLLRLGGIVRYVSNSVVLGFTAGGRPHAVDDPAAHSGRAGAAARVV